MKNFKRFSAQYRIISEQPNQNQNQNHTNEYAKTKKKLSKQNQEFINKISANGFKQFHEI